MSLECASGEGVSTDDGAYGQSAQLADNGTVNASAPGFVSKLFEIFSDSNRRSGVCGWARDGTTIVVQRIAEFERTVLPHYFKHNNYTSFVRQLNMYNFHKTVANPQIAEFYHPSFQMGRPDLLPLVKRKVRGHNEAQEQAAVPRARAYRPPTVQLSSSSSSHHQHQQHHYGSNIDPNNLGSRLMLQRSLSPPSPLANAGASDTSALLERFDVSSSANGYPLSEHESNNLSSSAQQQADRFTGDLNFDFSNSMPWVTSSVCPTPQPLQVQAPHPAGNGDEQAEIKAVHTTSGGNGHASNNNLQGGLVAADVNMRLAATQMACQQLAAEQQAMRLEVDAARQLLAATSQRLNSFLFDVREACLKLQGVTPLQGNNNNNAVLNQGLMAAAAGGGGGQGGGQGAMSSGGDNSINTGAAANGNSVVAHSLAAAAVAEAVVASLGGTNPNAAAIGVGNASGNGGGLNTVGKSGPTTTTIGSSSNTTATTTTTTQTTVVRLDMESVAGAVTAALAEVTGAAAVAAEGAATAAASNSRALVKRALSNDNNAGDCGDNGGGGASKMLKMTNDELFGNQGDDNKQPNAKNSNHQASNTIADTPAATIMTSI